MGWVTPALARYRRAKGAAVWHFCQNCPHWPLADFEDISPPIPSAGRECTSCASLRDDKECAFY